MRSSHFRSTHLVVALAIVAVGLLGNSRCSGIDFGALLELHEAGVDKYIGQFEPIATSDVGDG